MKQLAAILGLLAALCGDPAVAQVQFPQTLPSNSVWGRTGIGPGPGQAIPFASLTALLNNTPNTWTSLQTFNAATIFNAGATFNNTGIAINPTAASTTQGLNIAQSGPTSGTTSSTINYNQIVISGDNHNNASNLSNAVNIDYGFGGANFQGATNGLFVNTHLNSTGSASNPNPFYQSIQAQIVAFNSDQATSSLIALNAFTQTQTGVTGYNNITGIQTAAGMASSGGAVTRVGINSSAVGNFRATSAIGDAGIIIGSTSAANAWANGIVFSHFNGGVPIASTGCAICSDTNADTIATWADFHTYTITGNILNFKGYQVTGAGAITSGAVGGSSGSLSLNGSTSGTASVTANSTGALVLTSANGVAFVAASGANNGQVQLAGSTSGTATLAASTTGGHLAYFSSSTPTLTAGCNGAGSSISGNDISGTVGNQTAAATSCTVTFGTAFAVAPRCLPAGRTTPVTSYTPSTTTLVINFASTASAVFDWVCYGG